MLISLVSIIIVVFCAKLQVGPQGEAEKLFRLVERKTTAAKSIRLLCEGQATFGPKIDTVFKSTCLLREGNKMRLEHRTETKGKDANVLLISNGKNINDKHQGSPEIHLRIAPANLVKAWTKTILQAGLFFAIASWEQEPGKAIVGMGNRLSLSDFKLGVKERIGGIETQVIEYTLTFPEKITTQARTMLWVDGKTMLPAKRIILYMHDGKVTNDVLVTEIYKEFTLDPNLDEALFRINEKKSKTNL